MKPTTAKRISNDSPLYEADFAMDRIKKRLTSPEATRMSLSEIERMVGSDGEELLRELPQAHIHVRAAQERVVEVTGADGLTTPRYDRARVRWRRHGEISVTRNLYQAAGSEGLAPLDAALGLAHEHYSLEVRRLVAEESARASFDEVVELIAKRTRAHMPLSVRSRS